MIDNLRLLFPSLSVLQNSLSSAHQPMNDSTNTTHSHTVDPSTNDTSHLGQLDVVRAPKAREGRERQVYSSVNGARLVAGGIVLDERHERVLMISSSKHRDRWIIPKGGVEVDEKDNFAVAALREVWEEAGAVAVVVKKLGIVGDHRMSETAKSDEARLISTPSTLDESSSTLFPLCEFHFYQMKLLRLENDWPESELRQRRWCTYEEACRELRRSKRPELLTALNNSDIAK